MIGTIQGLGEAQQQALDPDPIQEPHTRIAQGPGRLYHGEFFTRPFSSVASWSASQAKTWPA
jgi:hypothetical protein